MKKKHKLSKLSNNNDAAKRAVTKNNLCVGGAQRANFLFNFWWLLFGWFIDFSFALLCLFSRFLRTKYSRTDKKHGHLISWKIACFLFVFVFFLCVLVLVFIVTKGIESPHTLSACMRRSQQYLPHIQTQIELEQKKKSWMKKNKKKANKSRSKNDFTYQWIYVFMP